jgi:hypothetical protein
MLTAAYYVLRDDIRYPDLAAEHSTRNDCARTADRLGPAHPPARL